VELGKDATWTTGNIWVSSWADAAGDLDVKPLVNDATWSTGGNYHVKAGARSTSTRSSARRSARSSGGQFLFAAVGATAAP